MRNREYSVELDTILDLCGEPRYALINLGHASAETFQPPGQISFDALYSFLDVIPNSDIPEAITKCLSRLQPFPSSARRLFARAKNLPIEFQSPGWALVRNLTLTFEPGENIRQFLDRPEMSQIKGLCIRGGTLDEDSITTVLTSPHLEGVERLELQCPLTDRAKATLRTLPRIRTLRELHPIGFDDLATGPAFAVESISCQGTPEIIQLLAERCPLLRELNLFVPEGDLLLSTIQALVSCEDLAKRLHRLEIGLGVNDAAIQHLLRCPYFTKLRGLKLSQNISPIGLAGFEGCSFLSQLEDLDFSDNPLDAEGWTELSRWPLNNLKELNLSMTGGGDDGASSLASSPHLANLRRLEISRCGVGPKGAASLASSRIIDGIEHLNLEENPILAAGAKAFMSTANLRALRNLLISPGEVQGAIAIGESPYLTRLESLYLCYQEDGSRGIDALCSSSAIVNLLRLTISSNLDDQCAKTLAECNALRSLRSLRLIGGMRMSSVGGKALFQSSSLENLWELSLSLCQIGDEGAEALAESPTMTRLSSLELLGCGVTEVGSAALAKSENMRRLRQLGIPDFLLGPWLQSTTISPVLRSNLETVHQKWQKNQLR